jgi:hypothetical protein
MKIVKTAAYQKIAAFRSFEWRQVLDKVIHQALGTLNEEWRSSLPEYDQDDTDKEQLIRTAVESDFIPFVPQELKSGNQDLEPKFRNEIREYVERAYGIDLFPAEEYHIDPRETQDLEEQWTPDNVFGDHDGN